MGVTLGTVLANLLGGPVTDLFGWRTAFIVVGLPGVLVALVLRLTVTEPPRGYTDPPGTPRRDKATFRAALGEVAGKPTFWLVTVGATFAAFGNYGINSFQSLFLNRSFGLTAGDAAVFINTPVGVVSAVGTLLTGVLAQRLTPRFPNAIAWLPGVGLLLAAPFHVLGFITGNLWVCVAALCVGGALKYSYLTGQFTIGQGLASAQARAVATAIMLFVINIIGYGVGPLFTGAVSDIIFAAQVSDLGAPDLVRKACEGAARKALSADLQAVCKIAHPQSLQVSMMVTSASYALAGLCFLVSCRWLRRDMVAV
jgi:predicted MFS family arabinose efflux permease